MGIWYNLCMELRDYQREAGAAIAEAQAAGCTRQLVVLPTGTGKTVIFAHLAQLLPRAFPMLVLAHRDELLAQAEAKLAAANPQLRIAREQAQAHADPTADVVVASVATLGRTNSPRLTKFDPRHFATVVVDEAHHAAAPSYRRVLDYFPDALRVGFTATPQRGDNVRLDDVFDEIVFYRDLVSMIDAGWLVPLRGWRMHTDVDLSQVRIVRGDYAEAELAQAVNVDARNEAVVDALLEFGPTRQTIVFCVDVAHAQAVAAHFTQRGIPAAAIWGEMTPEARAQTLQQFRDQELQVLTNCMVLTEGFDEPQVSLVIMARPTQSTLLYTQCVGRGTRLAEGKDDCVVVDIADISRKRRPVGLPSLMGIPPDFDLAGAEAHALGAEYHRLARTAPSEIVEVRSLADLDAAWERIDLFRLPEPNPELLAFSAFFWVDAADAFMLGLGANQYVSIAADALGRYAVRSNHDHVQPAQDDSTPRAEVVLTHTEDLAEAFRFADAWVRDNITNMVPLLLNDAQWRGAPATDKQLKWLKRYGVPVTAGMTKGHASYILDRLFAANPKKEMPEWLKKKIAAQRYTQGQ